VIIEEAGGALRAIGGSPVRNMPDLGKGSMRTYGLSGEMVAKKSAQTAGVLISACEEMELVPFDSLFDSIVATCGRRTGRASQAAGEGPSD
jgi:hypothetical protein